MIRRVLRVKIYSPDTARAKTTHNLLEFILEKEWEVEEKDRLIVYPVIWQLHSASILLLVIG